MLNLSNLSKLSSKSKPDDETTASTCSMPIKLISSLMMSLLFMFSLVNFGMCLFLFSKFAPFLFESYQNHSVFLTLSPIILTVSLSICTCLLAVLYRFIADVRKKYLAENSTPPKNEAVPPDAPSDDSPDAPPKEPAKPSSFRDYINVSSVFFWTSAVTLTLLAVMPFYYFLLIHLLALDPSSFEGTIDEMILLALVGCVTLLSAILVDLYMRLQLNHDGSDQIQDDRTVPTRTAVRWALSLLLSFLVILTGLVVYIIPEVGTFWGCYSKENSNIIIFLRIILLLVIPAQGICFLLLVTKLDSDMSRFYVVPQVKFGIFFIILQILSSVFMLFFNRFFSNLLLPITIEGIILAVSLILFTLNDFTRILITQQDTNLKKDVAAMTSLKSSASALPGLTDNNDLKKLLNLVSEELQFSDPVSSKLTAEADDELKEYMSTLTDTLSTDPVNVNAVKEQCRRFLRKLEERNRLCANK